MSTALLCLVIAITDGDTLKALCGEPGAYQQITVRIGAIDAPEKRQSFGEASRQHLAGLHFPNWTRITPKDTDHYGRTWAMWNAGDRMGGRAGTSRHGLALHQIRARVCGPGCAGSGRRSGGCGLCVGQWSLGGAKIARLTRNLWVTL